MPLHTDISLKVKRTYSQGLPKNVNDYSQKINNEFLNNNLHVIEEMEYRQKGITNRFKNYQNKYYEDSGILNHDLYFKDEDKIYPKVSGAQPLNIMNTGFLGSLISVDPNGTEIETNAGGNGGINYGASYLEINRFPNTGSVGKLYDQIAINSNAATGNWHVGVWNDLSSLPSDLLATTGAVARNSTYAMQSVTEFALDTTQNWIGAVMDSNNDIEGAAGSTADRQDKVYTYGALPDPAGTGYTAAATFVMQGKMNHS